MPRIFSVMLSAALLLSGLVSAIGCDKGVNPNVASSALDLALDLRVDHGAVAEHYAELKEQISFEKGKLKFKELRGDEVESKSWCYMKYTVGESHWGIVPGTVRDCTEEDDDDAKKRAKKRAKRWRNERTEAQEVSTEINYLVTERWFERALEAVAGSVATGFDFGACVADAIDVRTDLARRLANERCEALMDNEEIDVVALLGDKGLDRAGIDLDGVDDEDVEKAMKKYLSKLGELAGADGAAFLMLTHEDWSTACFDHANLDHGEAARSMMMRKAAKLCSEVAEAAAGQD
ncbi:MAG: hypothetical protein QF464_01990 [Myxococcota bacterium]|jgi:hypothetical protein|nr:hypothetical protein [Myxococcota bacterium]